jgi:hypothetical protein
MMEDIGIASPLYDLCTTLGIQDSVYRLPIDLIPWPVPYPIGVAWPVIKYGVSGNEDGDAEIERERGYIIVSAGGKAKLWIYGRNNGMPYGLSNISDAASVLKMGPRPLFCTPCRGVRISETTIGVLVPWAKDDVELIATHPLSRLYDAEKDAFLCWNPDTMDKEEVSHEWVEKNVIPMCTTVLVKAWSMSLEKLVKHVGYRRAGGGSSSRGMTETQLREVLKADRVYIMAKVVPPRDCDSYDQSVWVSIEVGGAVYACCCLATSQSGSQVP